MARAWALVEKSVESLLLSTRIGAKESRTTRKKKDQLEIGKLEQTFNQRDPLVQDKLKLVRVTLEKLENIELEEFALSSKNGGQAKLTKTYA